MDVAAICEAMVAAMTSVSYDGVTGKEITWSADGEPSKAPLVLEIVDGEYTAL